MDVNTHAAIERSLSGTPVAVSEGRATLRLVTTETMAADARGLVHGGFVFSLGDHAAMVAVNDPLVVLGSAQVKFLRPVRVGQELEARAQVTETEGKKRRVTVEVKVVGGESAVSPADPVFTGDFVCFVPEQHVLDRSSS